MVNIFSSYHHEKYFNASDWEEYPAQRFEMMSDILNDSTFIGETKAEVKSKLGNLLAISITTFGRFLLWNDPA